MPPPVLLRRSSGRRNNSKCWCRDRCSSRGDTRFFIAQYRSRRLACAQWLRARRTISVFLIKRRRNAVKTTEARRNSTDLGSWGFVHCAQAECQACLKSSIDADYCTSPARSIGRPNSLIGVSFTFRYLVGVGFASWVQGMVEKPIESWQVDDWNRALFNHYFAEGSDNTTVTRLAVTGEELSKAIDGIAGP